MSEVVSSSASRARLFPLFAGVGLALGLGSFEGASVQGIFPYLAGGLSTSSDHALWALTYFIVHWSLGISLMPWTTARYGARRVFLVATAVAAAGSAISALTDNWWAMLASRGMQGIAAGLLVPLSQSVFLRYTPKSRHGLVTIFWSNAMLAPFFVGPAIGGWLSTGPGYRWIFGLAFPLWIFAARLGGRGIPEEDGRPLPPPFDFPGFILLYAGLMALQITLDQGEQYGWLHSRFIVQSSLAAVIFLLLFAWRESICRHPLLHFHYLLKRNYWLGLLLLCLGWALFMGWASVLPLWAEQNLGYNGLWGSVLLLPIGLGAIPLSMLMDRLQGLMGLRRLASLCFVLFAVAYGTAYLGPGMGLQGLFLPMLFIGLGVGMLFVPLTMIILAGIPAEEIPRAATTSNFIRVFSANIGVSLLSVYWTRGASVAASQLRAETPLPGPQGPWPLWELGRRLTIEAATLSLDSLFRISMWLALAAALASYFLLLSPARLRAPDGPASYVEEEEMEAYPASAESAPGGREISCRGRDISIPVVSGASASSQ